MEKTLAEKMFIKSGHSIALINSPGKYLPLLTTGLPENVTISQSLVGNFDIIHYFVTKISALTSDIDGLKSHIKEGGNIWICYPKGGDKAALETDLNRDIIWETLKSFNLRPNRQISIDGTWSGLRFKIADG